MPQAKTQPEYYKGVLSEASSSHRADLENDLEKLYSELDGLNGVARLRKLKQINRLEQTLQWQGANPKLIPFPELKEHIQAPLAEDVIEDKYRARTSNRATAIRSYCVMCQGGSVAGVKECPSVICPLHSFRMGSDPLRGYELPKADPIVIEDDDVPDDQFEEGDDADEPDAVE